MNLNKLWLADSALWFINALMWAVYAHSSAFALLTFLCGCVTLYVSKRIGNEYY